MSVATWVVKAVSSAAGTNDSQIHVAPLAPARGSTLGRGRFVERRDGD